LPFRRNRRLNRDPGGRDGGRGRRGGLLHSQDYAAFQ
jgi:hypothetical protein